MVWTFCLGYGLDYLLATLALERDTLSGLAIGLLLELFCLSRLKVLRGGFMPIVG
jgi:hypothetical protein